MTASLLILTDFFQAANQALDYATNLARPLHARLVLLHVRRDSALDPEALTGNFSNLSKEAVALALSSVARGLPVPVVAEVGYGRVEVAVADAVARHHPALIVLGRPDHSDLPDELVQTTSLELLRHSPYPMLVVPHLMMTSSAPPRRVLMAVDGEPFSLGAHAGTMQEIFTKLKAEVTVLNVSAGRHELDPAALESVRQTGLLLDLAPAHARTVTNANPVRGILQVAQPHDFDLLVVVARERSFLGKLFHRSVTAQLLLDSALPVLVLPAQ
ncbi:universal stress protein [Microvirga sp. STS02]|uniref:universal stress protein n=1 Tax=Hymenobacter negativus TaxID=2795026 RepID=UPI0018DDA513|nr:MULTISPECIES: universal stress protein [Bacteria]MBH8567459.1 universal stress protein [Hymenobacter negativus]MBR7207191.1 universal stress protein [Microvirga sp. STS02]